MTDARTRANLTRLMAADTDEEWCRIYVSLSDEEKALVGDLSYRRMAEFRETCDQLVAIFAKAAKVVVEATHEMRALYESLPEEERKALLEGHNQG